jgi:hypothetical protein
MPELKLIVITTIVYYKLIKNQKFRTRKVIYKLIKVKFC